MTQSEKTAVHARPGAKPQRSDFESSDRTVEKESGSTSHSTNPAASIFQFSAKTFQQSMNQVSDMFGLENDKSKAKDAVQRSTRNVEAITQCNTALVEGSHKIGEVLLESAQTRARHISDSIRRLFACRTLVDLSTIQSDIIRESVEDAIECNLRLSESSAKIARKAVEHNSTLSA